MNINKVMAIFDEFRLKNVEETLIRHGVKGFTLHPVRGRGHYFDSFNENHLIKHIQMEVYAKAEQAKEIARLMWMRRMPMPIAKGWSALCRLTICYGYTINAAQ